MSGKPDDIPQDVWEAAVMVVDHIHALLPDNDGEALVIARVILAERERSAKSIDEVADGIASIPTGKSEEVRVVSATLVEALRTIAAVIRNGGEA